MAVTSKLYGNFLLQCMKKEHDVLNDDLRTSLHSATYTPDQDAHDYQNDLTNELAASGGYTTGGKSLASKSLTYTGATNVIMFDAADLVWSSATFTARTAVVYNNTPALASAKGLVCYEQSDADIPSSGGDFTISWNAAGILTVTPS